MSEAPKPNDEYENFVTTHIEVHAKNYLFATKYQTRAVYREINRCNVE